jgi:hypothetical protein
MGSVFRARQRNFEDKTFSSPKGSTATLCLRVPYMVSEPLPGSGEVEDTRSMDSLHTPGGSGAVGEGGADILGPSQTNGRSQR